MTTKEKLQNALDALWLIETGTWDNSKNIKIYAGKIRSALTTPRTEPVEETVYSVVFTEGHFHVFKTRSDADSSAAYGKGIVFEHVIKHQRPIPEPKTWEGIAEHSNRANCALVNVPSSWIGKKVIVEVCE